MEGDGPIGAFQGPMLAVARRTDWSVGRGSDRESQHVAHGLRWRVPPSKTWDVAEAACLRGMNSFSQDA